MVPPPVPPLPASDAVRRAVESCLADGSWARYDPERTERVEKRLGEYLRASHALLVQSGTLAVELALHAVGVQAGGLVAMPAYDYPGNFLSVHALGAKPLLVDVQPQSPQMSAESLKQALSGAQKAGNRVQAVLVSHLYGGMAPVEEIGEICRAYGVPWVEDACQCFGATYGGKKLGTYSDIGVFSFGGGKPLSVGRGGLLISNSASLRQRSWLKVSRGSSLAAPSVLQLAALEAQLENHAAEMAKRNENVSRLRDFLAENRNLQLKLDQPRHPNRSQNHHFPIFYRIPLEIGPKIDRNELLRRVWAQGIPLGEGFRALHSGRSSSRWQAFGSLEHAERIARRFFLLDPGCFREWSIGEVGARLQAASSEKTG